MQNKLHAFPQLLEVRVSNTPAAPRPPALPVRLARAGSNGRRARFGAAPRRGFPNRVSIRCSLGPAFSCFPFRRKFLAPSGLSDNYPCPIRTPDGVLSGLSDKLTLGSSGRASSGGPRPSWPSSRRPMRTCSASAPPRRRPSASAGRPWACTCAAATPASTPRRSPPVGRHALLCLGLSGVRPHPRRAGHPPRRALLCLAPCAGRFAYLT